MLTYFQQAADKLWGSSRQIKNLKKHERLVLDDMDLIIRIFEIKKSIFQITHTAYTLLSEKTYLTITNMKRERDMINLIENMENDPLKDEHFKKLSDELANHGSYIRRQINSLEIPNKTDIEKDLKSALREKKDYEANKTHRSLKRYYRKIYQTHKFITGMQNELLNEKFRL